LWSGFFIGNVGGYRKNNGFLPYRNLQLTTLKNFLENFFLTSYIEKKIHLAILRSSLSVMLNRGMPPG
jgi:hypothetical protein